VKWIVTLDLVEIKLPCRGPYASPAAATIIRRNHIDRVLQPLSGIFYCKSVADVIASMDRRGITHKELCWFLWKFEDDCPSRNNLGPIVFMKPPHDMKEPQQTRFLNWMVQSLGFQTSGFNQVKMDSSRFVYLVDKFLEPAKQTRLTGVEDRWIMEWRHCQN
jgi:hypothetical protein